MSKITDLKKVYEELKLSDNPFDIIFDFKEILLSNDSLEFLEFHFDIMYDTDLPNNVKSTIESFFWAEAVNNRNPEKVSEFLFAKYNEFDSEEKRIKVLLMLGHLGSKYAKRIVQETIKSDSEKMRYQSIIVLGWVGNKDDLESLNNALLNEKTPECRSCAATAMRQIWFDNKETKDIILHYLKKALLAENENEALLGIIITVQDLLKKKLGIKESFYGDTSGDVQKAKIKAIDALKKY